MLRRILAISDLHIGGVGQPMLGHPELLEDFLRQCADRPPVDGEELELVIHGDFVDFLAEKPQEAWTANEGAAVQKLTNVFRAWPRVFAELARCASKLGRFTVLLGNHDIELAYPRVREALFKELGTSPHRCHFVSNNECYRVGDVLIEHGNRYDVWNAVDHDGLREIVSAASRGEVPPRPLRICPGSRLVSDVMNPLKDRYHFIDLLKPEDKLVLLLLTTLEPALKSDLSTILSGLKQWTAQVYRRARWSAAQREDAQPGQRELVAAADDDKIPAAVAAAFRSELRVQTREVVGFGDDLLKLFLRDPTQSLRAKLLAGETIDDDRLRKIQLALAARLANDRTFNERDAGDVYADAAKEMLAAGVAKVVVMGHTHLSRDIAMAGGRYVNTGTWVDLIQVDPKHLVDSQAARKDFARWLTKLVADDLDGIRKAQPCYADITVDADGHVVQTERPMMRRHDRGSRVA